MTAINSLLSQTGLLAQSIAQTFSTMNLHVLSLRPDGESGLIVKAIQNAIQAHILYGTLAIEMDQCCPSSGDRIPLRDDWKASKFETKYNFLKSFHLSHLHRGICIEPGFGSNPTKIQIQCIDPARGDAWIRFSFPEKDDDPFPSTTYGLDFKAEGKWNPILGLCRFLGVPPGELHARLWEGLGFKPETRHTTAELVELRIRAVASHQGQQSILCENSLFQGLWNYLTGSAT